MAQRGLIRSRFQGLWPFSISPFNQTHSGSALNFEEYLQIKYSIKIISTHFGQIKLKRSFASLSFGLIKLERSFALLSFDEIKFASLIFGKIKLERSFASLFLAELNWSKVGKIGGRGGSVKLTLFWKLRTVLPSFRTRLLPKEPLSLKLLLFRIFSGKIYEKIIVQKCFFFSDGNTATDLSRWMKELKKFECLILRLDTADGAVSRVSSE